MGNKETKVMKKPSPGKVKPTVKPAAKSSPIGGSNLPNQVELIWAVALVVVAFVIGFLIRGFFPANLANTNTASTSDLSTYSSGSGSGNAPPLSPDQLNSRQLPQGHPDIGGFSQTGTATQTPIEPSTGNVKSDVAASGAVPPGGQSVTPAENNK